MPSEREVYRAALERIAHGMAGYKGPATGMRDVATTALAEGAALAENDTEAVMTWRRTAERLAEEKNAAKARLAQIAELLTPVTWRDREDVLGVVLGIARRGEW